MTQFETALLSGLEKLLKPVSPDWGFWNLLILFLTLVVLVIYTRYTFKLYCEAKRTNKYSLIPLIIVGFNMVTSKLLINTSASKNPVMNYKVLAIGQTHEGEEIIELGKGLAISINHVYEIDLPFWDTRLNYMYRVEYEDILGNKYATKWRPNHPDGLKLEILE